MIITKWHSSVTSLWIGYNSRWTWHGTLLMHFILNKTIVQQIIGFQVWWEMCTSQCARPGEAFLAWSTGYVQATFDVYLVAADDTSSVLWLVGYACCPLSHSVYCNYRYSGQVDRLLIVWSTKISSEMLCEWLQYETIISFPCNASMLIWECRTAGAFTTSRYLNDIDSYFFMNQM
jgi:hypothetical protein